MDLMALMTVPAIIYYSWFVLLFAVGALFVGHVLYWFWTPGPEWIKAKLSKGTVTRVFGRDGRVRYRVGKPESTSILSVKNLGPVIVTEGSALIDQFGLVNFDVFGEFAKSIPMWFPMLLQRIREDGTMLYKWSDFKMIIGVARGELPNDEKQAKKWKARLEELRTVACEMDGIEYNEEEFKKQLEDLEVKLRPYKTIKLADLVNMFPHNLDPQLLEAKSELKFAEMQKKAGGWTQEKVMNVVLVLVGSAVAFAIIYSMVKNGQGSTCHCEFGKVAVEGIARNLTG